MPVVNGLTIDVEEWFHVCGAAGTGNVPRSSWRVTHNVAKLLDILAEFQVRATFFVLGSVAEQEPELVPRIASAGHEVASHGWSHELVPTLGPERFRDEVRRTGELLAQQAGERPLGFRAPRWSLSAATPWAFEILLEEGYRYDSSCTPLPLVGDRRGCRHPYQLRTPQGALQEFPPLVTPTPLVNLPTGGGWGLRFFPLWLVRHSIRRLNAGGYPAVLFVHPREVDPAGPRLSLPPLTAFAAYGRRTDAARQLRHLLQRFPFGPLRDLIRPCPPV
jgi:polysaccharide deacetylase family protein (PEP-CTERM system associated)